MLEESEEGPIMTEEVMNKSLEEREIGPTSIDVTDESVSIGPTSIDVTDVQPPATEIPSAEQQEEKVQEQNRQIEKALDESKTNKRKQKRRVTSYLSSISKQLEKQGNQINKIALMIQSLQRQMRNKPTTGVKGGQSQQLQPVKKVQSQISQLQKQVALIQKDIHRIRTAPSMKARTRKRPFAISIMPKSKKNKSAKKTKLLGNIKSQKQKRTTRNRLSN